MCNDIKFLKRKFKNLVRYYIELEDDVDKVIEDFKKLNLPRFKKLSDEDFKEISNEMKNEMKNGM